ncbi:MAG: tripartite tricarboxylate transporter substrate binding protein, partial [Sphingomonadales bacterium]
GLLADLKSNAAAASFGAGGTVGSQDWIKAAMLTRAAGADHRGMRFISYEGGGQAIAALLGGHVDVFCGDAGEARAPLISGDLRALAILAPQRLSGPLGSIPTAREQGVDLIWPTVRGLYMGPGVSDSDYERWSRVMRRLLDAPGFARMARERGLDPYPMVGADVAAYAVAETLKMQALARSLGLGIR